MFVMITMLLGIRIFGIFFIYVIINMILKLKIIRTTRF